MFECNGPEICISLGVSVFKQSMFVLQVVVSQGPENRRGE